MNGIPKKIHYCWFGKNKISELSKKCMDTWKNTGFEIILWNEENIQFNDYLKKCQENKKYANMSNYARMMVLYEHGGIYLDTDVEIVGSFEKLLSDKMFIGWEDNLYINNAAWGSEKEHPLLKKCIENFNFDGTEAANLSSPHFVTKMIKQEYNPKMNGESQFFKDLSLYSREYFYPYSYYEVFNSKCVTQNTVSIHRWEKNW